MNLSLFLIAATVMTPAGQAANWFWADEQAKLAYSMSLVGRPYAVSLRTVEKGRMLDVSREGELVVSVPVHDYTAFAIREDRMFVAEFHYMASGCRVQSFDLTSGKPLWKTNLKGLGPISHSKYHNRVIMRFEKDVLVVYSQESAGRYRERLNPKTGKTLDTVIFEKDESWG